MTMKEIENLSGMSRANIRFYETEGLLRPARDSNGYRNYSEEDLNTLRKIRLLRTLHLSLEDIRSISLGQRSLTDVLSTHIPHLRDREEDLGHCRSICSQICNDGTDYISLDAEHYLSLMDSPLPAPELKEDTLPKVTSPWKRFFARGIDFALLGLLPDCLLSLVLHINESSYSAGRLIFDWIAPLLLLLLLEPVMISMSGTTPGKLLFGLRVTAPDGSRLSWRDAVHRTWTVLRYGYGFFLPVYSLVRLYRSFRGCKNEELLEWETDSMLTLKDKAVPLLAVEFLAVDAVIFCLSFIIWQAGALPINRGSLTTAEFCENYNQLQEYYGISRPVNVPDTALYNYIGLPKILDENGTWQDLPNYSQSFNDDFGELPALQFTETDDDLTEISFNQSYKNENVSVVSYADFMALAAVSYICAQDDYCLLPVTPDRIYDQITEKAASYEDFTFAAAGVVVKCRVDHSGYTPMENNSMMVPEYGQEAYYSIAFTMKKAE